ncbi:MAG: hypothetical protein ACRDRQ_24445 [Pseudonocardiaceae bacterium]
MLPDGFAWEPHTGRDMSLKLNGKTVALLVALDLGYGFRLDINPDKRNRRTEFMQSKERATAYLEAWATKWEERLRS